VTTKERKITGGGEVGGLTSLQLPRNDREDDKRPEGGGKPESASLAGKANRQFTSGAKGVKGGRGKTQDVSGWERG